MKHIISFDAWLFSAKLAWGNTWIRWMSILTASLLIGISLFYFWNTIPAVKDRAFYVMHYSLYLGIDDVRSWPWLFFLPVIWIVITFIDMLIAFGMYREDTHFSLSLVILALIWSFPFSGALFYLSFANL